MKSKGYKFYLEADIQSLKETVALKKEVASVIKLPSNKDKQPDLSYFSSIFVSTGTNLNNAHFLASELVLAENTIAGKAVDIEHEEEQIIGHIYSNVFTDGSGDKLELAELQNKEIATLDDQSMHIEIASVVYKTRFPEIATEIKEGKWKVSMEAYYTSYDVKIGGTILTVNEAQALGLDVENEATYGSIAKLVKAGEVVDEGKVARVLRGICFSGVGIVKNPANPPSVVLETASDKEEIIVLDYDNIVNKVTSTKVEANKEDAAAGDKNYTVTIGVCVNYKKEVLDSVVKDQSTRVLQTEWCTKYDTTCPVAGNAKEPECLRNVGNTTASISSIVRGRIKELNKESKVEELTKKLIKILKK